MPPCITAAANRLWVALILALCASFTCRGVSAADEAADGKRTLPLIFEETFEAGADKWEPTDSEAWKIVDGRDGKGYSLFKASKYKPPQRSPLNYSLRKDANVTDFVLEADVQSKARDYGHRDMCLFFGFQDPAHFYYAHVARTTDDHANQIFIVDGAERQKISTKTTPGTMWDDNWHHLQLVRDVKSGEIAVYFDDMQSPVMTATDKTFAWGRVGLGSFDDVGIWDNVKLRGATADKSPASQK